MKLKNRGFDHIEFAVEDINPHAQMYERMGFEAIGERTTDSTRSKVYAQGELRVMLTQEVARGKGDDDLSVQFQRKHGDGISTLALDVEDCEAAYLETIKKGARSAMEPKRFETEFGTVTRAEIWTPSDFRYAFIQRDTDLTDSTILFDRDLTVSRMRSPSPLKLSHIDHLTNNVGMGEMKTWVNYYKDIFGFKVSRHFDIRTGKTGLTSNVVESPDGLVKVPINEATEKESQVQEFVDRFNGPGVQHLALVTSDILESVATLRKRDFQFLSVPSTYYDEVPKRVPGVKEDLKAIEALNILLDGDDKGYLLQIFTNEWVGPFFFEFIQRRENDGFGEGNFRALFEAIERDQIHRGVLN